MSGEVELNWMDNTILRYSTSLSPEDISRKLNGVMSPERVAARAKELLSSANWLTMVEQEQALILRLQSILNDLEEVRTRGDYDNAEIQLRYLKEIGNRFDKRRQANAVDLNTLYGNQAQMMLRAIDKAISYLRGAFREKIDQEAWDEALREGMMHAQEELEKHKAIEQ